MQTVWLAGDDQKSAEDSGIWEDESNQSGKVQVLKDSDEDSSENGAKDQETSNFECNQCNYTTTSMDEFEDHMVDTHGTKKDFREVFKSPLFYLNL